MELTMKELIESKWQEILNILVKEHEISEVAVNTWIQPLIIQTITDDSITFFMVRGPRGIEFIKHKYYDIYLSMAIEQVTGKLFPLQSPNHLVVHTIPSFYMEEPDLERHI